MKIFQWITSPRAMPFHKIFPQDNFPQTIATWTTDPWEINPLPRSLSSPPWTTVEKYFELDFDFCDKYFKQGYLKGGNVVFSYYVNI